MRHNYDMDMALALDLDRAIKKSEIEEPDPNRYYIEQDVHIVTKDKYITKRYYDRDSYVENLLKVYDTPKGKAIIMSRLPNVADEYNRKRQNPKSSARSLGMIEGELDALKLLYKFGHESLTTEEKLNFFRTARFAYRNRNLTTNENNQLADELSTLEDKLHAIDNGDIPTGEDDALRLRWNELSTLFSYRTDKSEYQLAIEEIDKIKERYHAIVGYDESESIKAEIKDLSARLDTLGYFKKKEKAELQEMITSLKTRLQELSPRVEKEAASIEGEIKEYSAGLTTLKNRIDEIEAIGIAFSDKTKA